MYYVNNWLSNCLKIKCKLIKNSFDNDKSFVNEGQYLIINQSSVDDFNKKNSFNYDYSIFRPNILINGIKPYIEDNIFSIENNDNKLIYTNKCKRCNMINVNKNTGNIDSSEPLLTLSKTRRTDGKILFGILMKNYNNNNNNLNIGDIFKISHQ